MAEALVDPRRLGLVVPALAAAMLGVAATHRPGVAAGALVLVFVTLLAFRAPVAHLTLLLFFTAIVPYSIENRYSPGGTGSVGLLPSDLLVLTGLLRTAMVLPSMRLDRRRLTVVGLIVLFVAYTLLEVFQGIHAGRSLSDVGDEFRALGLGFATALITLAVLQDRAAHRKMLRGLLVLGIALGAWGVWQWVGHVPFSAAEDFGVRTGVSLTSSGRGQIQGGLFSFPVAVILASAALFSGRLRGLDRRLVLLALGLNLISLLLTFERTFWVATAVGVLIVALRSGRARRARALMWITVCAATGLVLLSAVAPGTLKTAEQRLFSIGSYQVDNSVRYRTVESGIVLDKIRESPWFGSGLGDSIYWGQPWTQTKPAPQTYTHVGYLWLLWREGIIGAGIILTLILLAAVWPGRAAGGGLVAAIRVGCQASLVALLIVNLLFPVFQGTQITYVLGFLIAYAATPVVARARAPAAVPARRLGGLRPTPAAG